MMLIHKICYLPLVTFVKSELPCDTIATWQSTSRCFVL